MKSKKASPSRTNIDLKYKFLTEQPSIDDLKFGHEEILDTLQSITTTCITPFTIGLFGKWGSGKSSIAESLQKRLLLLDKGIPVILFDVWKHQGDALRRTFLKDMVTQLHSAKYGPQYFDKVFVLKDEIDSVVQTSNTTKIEWKFKTTLPLIITLTLLLGSIFGVSELLIYIWPAATINLRNFITTALSATTISATVVWLFNSIKDFVTKTEVAIRKDRITDPHEFEKEFKRILRSLKNSRIVIIFDNLDRVSGDVALEIISTIKTFLEPADRAIETKQVVFLIPCDVGAIKKHLNKGISNDENDRFADEFLRKFFNSILWIPDFYSSELETYASAKLKETTIQEFDDDHLAWLITQVFKDNPRQIIQFINTLISNYILLTSKSKRRAFGDDVDFHKKNVAQLAKYLLLVQRFPGIMDSYKSTLTYDINIDLSNDPKFQEFRTQTSDIGIHSLEPFFNFKLSDHEKAISGSSKLFQYFEDNEIEKGVQHAIDLDLKNKINDFSQIVAKQLKPKNNSIAICSFIQNIFTITSRLQLVLTDNCYRDIQTKFETTAIPGIEKISPNLLVSEFLQKKCKGFKVNSSTHEKIVTRWVNILNESKVQAQSVKISRDYELEMTPHLLEYISTLPVAALSQYKDYLAQYSFHDIELCSQVISHQNAHKVIKSEMIQRMISHPSLNTHDGILDFKKVTDLTKQVNSSIINNMDCTPFFQKWATFFHNEFRLQSEDSKRTALEAIYELLTLLENQVLKVSNANIINDFCAAFVNSFNQSRWNLAHYFVPISIFLENTKQATFENYGLAIRKEFFSNLAAVGATNTVYALDRIDNQHIFIDANEHRSQLYSLISQNDELFKALYKYASPNTQDSWLKTKINGNKFILLNESIETINDSPIIHKQDIFELIVEKLRAITTETEGLAARKFLDGLKISENEVVPSNFYQAISDLIQNPNVCLLAEKYFDSRFISKKGQTEVAVRLLSVLNNGPYNASSLRLITIGYSGLPPEKQQQFVQIVFEKLLLNPTSEVWIVEGGKIMKDLNVTLDYMQLTALQKAIQEDIVNKKTQYLSSMLTALKTMHTDQSNDSIRLIGKLIEDISGAG